MAECGVEAGDAETHNTTRENDANGIWKALKYRVEEKREWKGMGD